MQDKIFAVHLGKFNIDSPDGKVFLVHERIDDTFLLMSNKEFCMLLVAMLTFYEHNKSLMPDDFSLGITNTALNS